MRSAICSGVPISWVRTGIAPDGRPIYSGNTNDFVLTNTNAKGDAVVLSVGIAKEYDNFDWSLGYAYTDADDVNPMTSSVAFSNFSNYTTSDAVNPDLGTSDYEIAHRFNLTANYEQEFISGLTTRASLFGTFNEGAPYSYVFATNGLFSPLFNNSRQLAYIPTGMNDPLIAASSDQQALADLVAFIDGNKDLQNARGGIIERNSSADDWWSKFDLRLSQELPGLRADDRAEAFVTIENVGNLLNDKWGVLREHGFPGNAQLYSANIVNGQYEITSFNANADNDSVVVSPSLWQVHFGIKYKF